MTTRRYGAAGLVLLCLLMPAGAIAAELPTYNRVRILETPVTIEDAELTNQDGEAFRLSDLRGRVALIFFGFTNCPDVCPTAMEHLRQFRESGTVDFSDVAVVLVSVDGENDTPTVMKTYLAKFSQEFIGLTGDPSYVKTLASQFAASFFKRGSSAHGGYTMAHSPQIFVVDPDGKLRAEFYAPAIEAMAGVTRALLDETG